MTDDDERSTGPSQWTCRPRTRLPRSPSSSTTFPGARSQRRAAHVRPRELPLDYDGGRGRRRTVCRHRLARREGPPRDACGGPRSREPGAGRGPAGVHLRPPEPTGTSLAPRRNARRLRARPDRAGRLNGLEARCYRLARHSTHAEYLERPRGPPAARQHGQHWWVGTLWLAVHTGDAVPSLRNRLLTGGLNGQTLLATTLTPAGADLPPGADAEVYARTGPTTPTPRRPTPCGQRIGRIRHVEQGPDGGLYLGRRTATGGLATASRGSTTTSSSASPRPSERRARPAETRSVNHGYISVDERVRPGLDAFLLAA